MAFEGLTFRKKGANEKKEEETPAFGMSATSEEPPFYGNSPSETSPEAEAKQEPPTEPISEPQSEINNATEQPPEQQEEAAVTAAPPAQEEPNLPPSQEQPEALEDEVGDKKDTKMPARLGDKLIKLGLISQDQLDVALKEQKATNSQKLIGQMLVDMGFIAESALGEVLAESAGTDKFDPKEAVLDQELIRKVPKDLALRQKVVPVGLEGNSVIIAMADVYNVLAIDQVRRYFPKTAKMKPIYCTEGDIYDLIEEYYDYETSVDGVIKEIEEKIEDKKQLDGEAEGYVNPTVRLVNAFLVDAIRSGSSDIHFEPEGTFLRIRYRIDGQLVQVRALHRDYWQAVAVRIKIMSQINIAEFRIPQDGRISYNIAGRDVDFRVATQPTIHGENIVMRILDKKKALMPFTQLGFTDHNEKLLKKLLKRPEGIIIVTGPTGSGKTTTLYSVLEYINTVEVNIMTLEDPVEYQLSLIRQANVREGSGMGFADGIKSIMRQDPDIVFIGEVRDEVTANMAVRAAMTGHKVFTTLHTNDAMGIIPRLMDIGVSPEMLAGSVICGLAQRLARRLCKSCKEEYTATAEDCQILGIDSTNPPQIYRAKGCDDCGNKGYRGRVALHEIMPVDKEMDELIARSATRKQMLDHLYANGYRSMADDAASKIIDGTTDIKEMIRAVDVTDRL